MFESRRNKNGHWTFTIRGHTFNNRESIGGQEVAHLAMMGVKVSSTAKSCLLSPNYENHLLIEGKNYQAVLVSMRDLKDDDDCTIDTLRHRAVKRYGYKKPRAGIISPLCGLFAFVNWQYQYIVAPHDTINDSVGRPGVFYTMLLSRDERWLDVHCRPGLYWSEDGGALVLEE